MLMPQRDVSDVAALAKRYINASEHPDLKVYRRDLGSKLPFDIWHWRLTQFARLGRFKGGEVLDVGCGFGWDALGISLIGNCRVTAIDVLPSMIETMAECLEALGQEPNVDVRPLCGDICTVDLPDQSFDGIFSSEAVEHIHDLDQMFARAWALLRPGGRLLIANDSNALNPETYAHTVAMWAKRDTSFEHAEWLRRDIRPVEHQAAEPYAVMRRRIIEEQPFAFDGPAVRALTAGTAGMIRAELVEACGRFASDQRVPVPPPLSWCRNPETGEYAERLLDPFELMRGLRRQGFKVSLRHLFRKAPLSWANGVSIAPLHRILFRLRPQFVLLAQKP
jgi:SAM-dependent methyltransferase